MTCSTPKATAAARKRVIADLFAAGNAKQALFHRLAACCHATDCGRLCEHLVKAPGKALVHCVGTGTPVELYPALADPAFACPAGRF